jgi:lysophospholipase L1-like esterase
LVISTVLSFFIAEGLCRFVNIGNPEVAVWKEDLSEGTKYPYKPNGKLLYRYPDNPRGYFNKKNEVIGTINSMGFRGTDKNFEKQNSIIRIAFLGDSFTLGIGVKDEDTLSEKFKKALLQRYGNIETLNFGLSGSSTSDQIKLLEEYVISFKPDVVVIVLFLNDAMRTGTIRYLSRANVFSKIRKYSFFINGLIGNIEKIILQKKMIHHYLEGYTEVSAGWEEVKAGIRKGKFLSEQNGFQFMVVLYPVLFNLSERYPFRTIHEKIDSFCKLLSIPFLDLFKVFKGKKDSKLWVHPTDQHPNEVAHQIAGLELSKYFVKQKLIENIRNNL